MNWDISKKTASEAYADCARIAHNWVPSQLGLAKRFKDLAEYEAKKAKEEEKCKNSETES